MPRNKLKTWLAGNADKLARRAAGEPGVAVQGLGHVRPKRKPGVGFQWALQDRLYVPVPLEVKCEIMRLAREANMSQAELGLRIVQAALADRAWLAAVLAAR